MTPAVIHNTFTIERVYPAAPARVFRALSEVTRKRRWFAEGAGFIVDSYSLDFRVDGFERCRFRFGNDGPPMTYDAVHLDIVPNERIVAAYGMTIGGKPLSSSLITNELVASGGGTVLRFTEHTAFLDGNDGSASRREGSIGLLARLAEELEHHA